MAQPPPKNQEDQLLLARRLLAYARPLINSGYNDQMVLGRRAERIAARLQAGAALPGWDYQRPFTDAPDDPVADHREAHLILGDP